jgi:hypothetical protein
MYNNPYLVSFFQVEPFPSTSTNCGTTNLINEETKKRVLQLLLLSPRQSGKSGNLIRK